MKEVIALLAFICITVIAIHLRATQRFDNLAFGILLVCSVVAGIAIANYDLIKKLRYKDFEIETFQREVESVKSDALEQFKMEVNEQKNKLESVIAEANEARRHIESLQLLTSRIALEVVKIVWLQTKTKSQFGTAQATAAAEEIEKSVNFLLNTIIPSPAERQKWVNELQSLIE